MKLNSLLRLLARHQGDQESPIILSVPDGSGKPGHVVWWTTTEAHRTRLMNGQYAFVIEADKPVTQAELGASEIVREVGPMDGVDRPPVETCPDCGAAPYALHKTTCVFYPTASDRRDQGEGFVG